ncbi:hypothetical protein V3C99_008427 [Haemonchus contortus]|uniref:non-specific serine/threonine protein kinase n=1 Tax=Haemonchus contortus TaxID=6289 RepID=A0A7I4YNV4_HAECO
MPLGLFGSSSKPQPLTSIDSGGYKDKKEALEKDGRGTVLRLENSTVTIEKKLAEGGFAIVYLVSDKNNRKYALKRQFINDDNKQVDACRREFQIISSLKGHKNIVAYVDHILTKNKSGIYDYMLLTAYYKTSVLQLMNDRLLLGQSLRSNEVLSIFCDMCEAVARLHHSVTPIIHRDLKVENILVDERNRAAPPVYVLCDFGSATTKVLSSSNYSISFIQDEIEKYTTLSYRSPEMIDLYCGKPIGTKADIWAMGVMLYKLCYFCLPFGESAMAIQNGAFSFPSEAQHPDSLKAIIRCLLDADVDRRPTIYQCSVLAFAAADRSCPVRNVRNCRKPSLTVAIQSFLSGRHYLFDDEPKNEPSSRALPPDCQEDQSVPVAPLVPNKASNDPSMQTTSVLPRLRPKPLSSTPVTPFVLPNVKTMHQESFISKNAEAGASVEVREGNVEVPVSSVHPSDLGFTDLETAVKSSGYLSNATFSNTMSNPNPFVDMQHAGCSGSTLEGSASSTSSLPVVEKSNPPNYHSHRRNTSDTSHIIRSAFKPYSQWKGMTTLSNNQTSLSSSGLDNVSDKTKDDIWNPFLAAPFGSSPTMDDSHFGRCFDELPRKSEKDKGCELLDSSGDFDRCSIDSTDPFGAAPFVPFTEAGQPEDETKGSGRGDADSVGSVSDIHERAMEDDSEQDEQRMVARRRFSYENIDGVGDDASSDSRGRTDHDSTDDVSKNEESSFDEFNGDGESSQHTDVVGIPSDDDCAGSRPLLEDDALDDDEEEVFDEESSRQLQQVSKSLFVDPDLNSIASRKCTNPFMISASDDTPKISPVLPNVADALKWQECDRNVAVGYYEPSNVSRITANQPNELACGFAPATLPRQSTPLTAVPRFAAKPTVAIESPSIPGLTQPPPVTSTTRSTCTVQYPVLPTTSVAKHVALQPNPSNDTPKVSLVDRNQPFNVQPVCNVFADKQDSYPSARKVTTPSFIEGPRTPKPKKSKDKEKKRFDLPCSESEVETDGSEAEMCSSTSSDKTNMSKKKKRSFPLLGSNPSVAPLDLKMSNAPSAALLKKSSGKRASIATSTSRKSSGGVLNASFVNSSFLSEDLDSPAAPSTLRL